MPALGMGLGVPKGSFGDSGLLLDEQNIDVAFSLRKVRAEYNGPCVRVRNNAGTLKDIGFLSNGSIDEAALNAHCGDNDGTVQTWYNQSAEGGRFNAVQDTAANQPIIYDASEGGYLGYLQNTGDMYLRFENQLTGVTGLAVVYENVSSTTSSAYVLGEHRSDGGAADGVSVGHPTVPGFSLVSGGANITSHTGDTTGEKHAGFGYMSGSPKFSVVDGYVVSSTTATFASIDLDYIFARSKSDNPGTFDFLGKVWEVFLSTSDLSGDRIAIENSILSANGLTVPDQTLLEKYDGAEGAFSTRCINREHVGPIIKLRATQTTEETEDVYLDYTGVVNKSRITSLCTDDEAANALVDGFVETWYDQSSFGYDVTNVTDAQQPKIHDATNGIVLLNGQPAVEFDGSDDILESSSQTISSEAMITVASTDNESTTAQHILRHGQAFIRFDGANQIEYRNNANLLDNTANNFLGLTNDNAVLASWYTKGTSENDANASWKWYVNGDLLGTKTGDNLSSESGGIKIGAQSPSSERLNGKVCEAIIIDRRDAHYDRADQIHKDINSHYLIYQEVDTTSGFVSNSAYNVKLAHSVRKLSDSLLCCKIERSSDNATKNIGWGSDGFVDTQAIKDFCGSSSGKVLTVYDQSGQGYHAYADTSLSNFLWIYDGTDIYTSNGRPAFYQKDASTSATYRYSNSGAYSGFNQDAYSYTDQTKASYSVVAGPMTQNADTAANGQDYLITTGDMTLYRDSNQRLRVDIFDSGEGIATPISTADAASSQRVIMAGGTLGGTVWGHIDDSEDNDNVDSPEGWYGDVDAHSINVFFSVNSEQADNPYLQETIFYDNDFRVEGTLESLKTEINDAFDVFASDETPTSGFLNEFSGAAAAYSVRKLGDSPVCMRVRKTVSTVDYYQVIGFDSNGDLDTAAIEEFGGSNDVFVQTWYDQSGNGKHATQDTNAAQPKIYDGTNGVEKENGYPTINFDGTDDYLEVDGYIVELSQNSASVFALSNVGTSDASDYLLSEGDVESPYSSNFILGGGGDVTPRPVVWVNGTDFGTQTTGQNLIGFDYDGTNFQAHLDGGASGSSGTATVNAEIVGGNAVIGSRASGDTDFYSGNLQELITYKSDKSSSRSDIEDNINNYYLIYQSASTTPATGLLADHPAEAAYSVRQLGDALLCMKVASGATGNPTKNIGFKNGVLDTAAIEEFCGNNDGFVATWYDQSGNDNNADQVTHTKRPKIFDQQSGIVKENGKPALELDGVNDGLSLSSVVAASSQKYTFTTHAVDSSDAAWSIFYETASTDVVPLGENGGTSPISFGYTLSDAFRDGTSLVSDINRTGLYDTYSPAGQSLTTLDFSGDGIGGFFDRTSFLYTGTAQEILIYDSDKSSSRSDIETNINNHFKIYTPFTTGLLDSYPGASAAYSLRRLSSTYTGDAIEVTSNSNTKDIGFDSEGNLDTSALEYFCGSNDGTISKWYDQSGNGNDTVQATSAQQPKIYDGATGLVTDTEKPAIDFTSSITYLRTSSTLNVTGDQSFYFVASLPDDGLNHWIWSANTGSNANPGVKNQNSGKSFYWTDEDNSLAYLGNVPEPNRFLMIATADTDLPGSNSFINGKDPVTDNQRIKNIDNYVFTLGASPTSAESWSGKMQEFVMYNEDITDSRKGVENNVNAYYEVYGQPLLDVVPDAAAAYSLRKLRSDYTGPAINVFNGTDYKDIYFKANGTLDTNAISKFCGSNNGTVAIWYDQSGNNNHAKQTTPANRPKIYDGTTGLVTESGKPALDFDGVNDDLRWTQFNQNGDFYNLFVHKGSFELNGSSTGNYQARIKDGGLWLYDGTAYQSPTTSPSISDQYHLLSYQQSSGALRFGVDNTSYGSLSRASGNYYVGGFSYSSQSMNGKTQEVIFYSSDQSSNRTVIEANINHYYSIY